MTRFWKIEVTCAHCGEKQDTEKVDALPVDWVGIIAIQKMPAIAKTPQEVLTEQAQYQRLAFPVCSDTCGAKLLMERALSLARTTAVKDTLRAEFIDAAEDN